MDEDPLTIEIPDYGTFDVGDDVQVGGGFVLEHTPDVRPVESFAAGGVAVPASGAENDVFLALSGVPATPR